MWMTFCAVQTDSDNGVRYFLRPTKLRWSRKENLREGTQTPGVDLLANTIDGARTANSLLGPTKTATHLAQSRSVRIGVVRFKKI